MYRLQLPLVARRELERQYALDEPVLRKALHEFQRRVTQTLARADLHPTIKYRLKDFDSLYGKLLRRARDLGDGDTIEITDLLGVRVVCAFIEDIERVCDALSSAYPVRETERKGAELSSREFGYSSLHLLIDLPVDIRESFHLARWPVCEVQVRTILQDAWAEVEHELVYKAELTPLDENLRRKLAALNANLTLSDIIFQEIRDYQRAMQSQLMKRRETFWEQLDEGGSGQPSEAEADVIRTGSDTIDGMVLRALHAHNERDYAGAVAIYGDVLAYQPVDHIAAVIHMHRGMARFALGDRDGAVEDFSATIRLSPRTVRAYYYRGVVFRALEQGDRALADFSRCLEYDPYHVDARIARARLYRDRSDIEAARADCDMATKLDPDNPAVIGFCRDLLEGHPAPARGSRS